jgi:hypothetical protein
VIREPCFSVWPGYHWVLKEWGVPLYYGLSRRSSASVMFLHSGVSPGPCLNHLEGLALLTNSRDCVPLIFPGQEEKTPPQHVYYHSKVSEKIFTARSFYFFFFWAFWDNRLKEPHPGWYSLSSIQGRGRNTTQVGLLCLFLSLKLLSSFVAFLLRCVLVPVSTFFTRLTQVFDFFFPYCQLHAFPSLVNRRRSSRFRTRHPNLVPSLECFIYH